MTFVLLITGDRNWSMANEAQKLSVWSVLWSFRNQHPIVVHGAARGVDSIADSHARRLGFDVHPHPADWETYHRAAGPIRNKEMLEEKPNLVAAFHDDIVHSKGTKNMLNQARKAGIPVILVDSAGNRTVMQ